MKRKKREKSRGEIVGTVLEDPRHLRRWMIAQQVGGSQEAAAKAVAQRERISYAAALASIRRVEEYNLRTERGQLEAAGRDLVISIIPKAKETLRGLLDATEIVEIVDSKTGKTKHIEVADKTTRLEGMRVVKDLIAAQQPKVPLVEQTIAQTTQVAAVAGGSETIEERMSRLRSRAAKFNELPPETAAVPEYIDAGDEAEEEAEEEDEDSAG